VNIVYRKAALAASQGLSAALVVVTDAAGHTPQVVGAKMLVYGDKQIEGTVGGGRFEFEVIERASTMVNDEKPTLVMLQLGAELGMCCGGRMEVLITPIGTKDTWLSTVSEMLVQDNQVWLTTSLESDDLGVRNFGEGNYRLSGRRRYVGSAVITGEGGRRMLVERINKASRLVLFGAGHVAQPTAHLAHMLGYQVVVIDDRPEWNSEERFPEASQRILEPYEDVLFDFESRPDDALLIVTRGHDFDQLILESVIGLEVAYLGMIGSDTKVKKAVKRLQARGVNQEQTLHLHAPIGLSIGALTPEEIAVSIVAEIVAVKRGEEMRS